MTLVVIICCTSHEPLAMQSQVGGVPFDLNLIRGFFSGFPPIPKPTSNSAASRKFISAGLVGEADIDFIK